MTQTVLILGANGRFGRAATTAFANAGWNIRLWLRPGAKASVGHSVHHGDLHDAVELEKAAVGADVIVNALNPLYPDWATELPRITRAVINAARNTGATVMIPGNIYNFGTDLPEVLTEDTPQIGDHKKAALRIEMEEAYRNSGVRTIILRAGDFIEGTSTNNWFDTHITKNILKGKVTYPGPLDRPHAWAHLPDMARAAEMLVTNRDQLAPFQTVGFSGYTLTGQQLIDVLGQASGAPLKQTSFPWWMLRLLSPMVPLIREVLPMRYLWNRPHQIDGAELARLAPDFHPTPVAEAITTCLTELGLRPTSGPADAGFQDFVAA
ncbi:MAG: NAD(P)H-binding protein [Pikeienuella sp.]